MNNFAHVLGDLASLESEALDALKPDERRPHMPVALLQYGFL